ncbi:hypothetical protein [Streptomyces sp. NPDC127098]|uniref:MmyB family transcriptional regulator n=1 Tax=Streptomyces sp. NPDC127098 TaxID=3347137 RepID=UPI00364F042E
MIKETISRSPHVVYVMDSEWNVMAYNEKFEELYGWACTGSGNDPTVNMVRFVLFHELAPRVLANWYEDWLLAALIFFNIAARHAPDNLAYLEIRRDMERYPTVLRAQTVDVPKAMQRGETSEPLFEKRRHAVYWPDRPDVPVAQYSLLLGLDLFPGWRMVVDGSSPS